MAGRRAGRAVARVVAHLRAHHEWYWAPLVYCAAVAYLYRDLFFPGDSMRVGFGWDTIESYWADLAYLAGALRDGEAPLWNPFEVGGSPAYARPSRATFYAANWPLVGYGAVAGEVSWWLVQIKMVGHHVLAGLMMHLFVRSRGLSRSAACVGGLAWMASAPMLLHKASAILWPMVWAPLVWLAADRLARGPSWRTGCALGATVVLAGTAGSPPGFFYALLMALPYGVLRVAQALWDARGRGQLGSCARSLALALGVAAGLAVAMLLITVLPTQELTALSQRAQRTVGYALQRPIPVRETLTGLWAPSTGIHDPYMGVAVLMLALCCLALRPLRDRGAPVLFAGCAVFFMVLAFGAATPVLEWLVRHVPGFGLFRACNRYKILATPMVAALAAYGVASLQQAARSWSRERITAAVVAAAVVAVVVTLVAVLPHGERMDPRIPASRSVWMAGIAAVLVVAMAWVPRRLAFLPAVLLLPLIAYEPQYFVHFRSSAMEPRPDSRGGEIEDDRRWLAGLADVRTRYRVYDEFVMEQRAGSRLGIREFRSYPAGSSLEYRRYGEVIRRVKEHPELLAAFNVRYVLHGGHHRIGKRVNHIKRPPDRIAPAHFRRLEPRVYEALHPAPLAAWYGAVVQKRGADAVLDEVLASVDEDGVRRYVVVEPGAVEAMGSELAGALTAAAADPPEPVEAELVRYGYNEVRLRVHAPAAGVVMLNDAHYPGWEVEVDGRPARPFFVNWLVRGVAVGPGEHDIVWRFRPAGYGLLLSLWLAGALILLAALVAPRRRSAVGR